SVSSRKTPARMGMRPLLYRLMSPEHQPILPSGPKPLLPQNLLLQLPPTQHRTRHSRLPPNQKLPNRRPPTPKCWIRSPISSHATSPAPPTSALSSLYGLCIPIAIPHSKTCLISASALPSTSPARPPASRSSICFV